MDSVRDLGMREFVLVRDLRVISGGSLRDQIARHAMSLERREPLDMMEYKVEI
jgi:hypothetical protein